MHSLIVVSTYIYIYRVCYLGWNRRFDEYVCENMLSRLDQPISSFLSSSLSLNLYAKYFYKSSYRLANKVRTFDDFPSSSSSDKNNDLCELKLAMLYIEAALPIGCSISKQLNGNNNNSKNNNKNNNTDDDEDVGWNEIKAYKWCWSVKNAFNISELMELFIILEESIEISQWFIPNTITSLYKTLPSRIDAFTYSNDGDTYSKLALRIFTFDSLFQYDKVSLPLETSSSSSSCVYIGNNTRLMALREGGGSTTSTVSSKPTSKVKTRGTLTPPNV